MMGTMLRSYMVLRGYTQATLADELRISRATMSAKCTGKSLFNTKQIRALIRLLQIPLEEVGKVFFSD